QAGTVEAVTPPDDAETETDADMTINDPGSAEGTNAVRSSLYEYMGCVRLDSAERREAAMLPQLAELTPTVSLPLKMFFCPQICQSWRMFRAWFVLDNGQGDIICFRVRVAGDFKYLDGPMSYLSKDSWCSKRRENEACWTTQRQEVFFP
ncbi:unnamed protein product, partial [Scytosiphon promiscuus]